MWAFKVTLNCHLVTKLKTLITELTGFSTYINDSSSLGVQHAAQCRPAGQHGAQQVGVKQSQHVLRLSPQ